MLYSPFCRLLFTPQFLKLLLELKSETNTTSLERWRLCTKNINQTKIERNKNRLIFLLLSHIPISLSLVLFLLPYQHVGLSKPLPTQVNTESSVFFSISLCSHCTLILNASAITFSSLEMKT